MRDAVGNVSNAVSLVSSLPMMAEHAPRLAALDEAFNRLEGMSADATQLRSTLRALVVAQNSDVTPETVACAQRANAAYRYRAGSRSRRRFKRYAPRWTALQARLDKRKSRMLFVFNLVALLSTLMLAWIVYTQVIVIQHHWARVRESAGQ